MAGLGKTSLAAHLAYQLRDQFKDGILWVTLTQTEPMAALLAIAEAYDKDFSVYSDLGTRSSKLRELLAYKNALLVLDDVQDDAQIRPLLPPDGDCAVLITSRRHDLAVTGMAYRLTLSPLNSEKAESEALFRHFLDRKKVRAEAEPLQQLADWLGHLPLALQIAAQRLKHEPGWTAAALLSRLQQAERPLDLLVWGDQSVRHQFAASCEALTPLAQELPALLGSFPGSFVPVHVAAVAGRPLPEVEDGLRQLYNQSLLSVNRQNRYELHPLLRLFCQELPQQASWPHRFVAHFTSLAAQPETADEQQAIVAAIAPAERLEMDAVVVTAVGFTAMKQGNPDKADSYYQEALALAEANGLAIQQYRQQANLGEAAMLRGQFRQANAHYRQALQMGCGQASAREVTYAIIVEVSQQFGDGFQGDMS